MSRIMLIVVAAVIVASIFLVPTERVVAKEPPTVTMGVIRAMLRTQAQAQAKAKDDTLIVVKVLVDQHQRAIESRRRLIQQYQDGITRANQDILILAGHLDVLNGIRDSVAYLSKSLLLEENR